MFRLDLVNIHSRTQKRGKGIRNLIVLIRIKKKEPVNLFRRKRFLRKGFRD